MVIWLIGLSGSGKSTIGEILTTRLRRRYTNVIFLDGDVLRELWGDSPGHDIEGRYINARRISHLSDFLEQQGCIIVAAVLSIFPEWQQWNRDNFKKYFEIFLDIDITILMERDTKGLYSAAINNELKNVVGIDIEFPKPLSPDVVISSNMQEVSPSETLDIFFDKIPLD